MIDDLIKIPNEWAYFSVFGSDHLFSSQRELYHKDRERCMAERFFECSERGLREAMLEARSFLVGKFKTFDYSYIIKNLDQKKASMEWLTENRISIFDIDKMDLELRGFKLKGKNI